VAIGSSSTEGDGASSPAASYPSRLSAALRDSFLATNDQRAECRRGGQEAPDEAARFKNDVIAKGPFARHLAGRHERGVEDYFLVMSRPRSSGALIPS